MWLQGIPLSGDTIHADAPETFSLLLEKGSDTPYGITASSAQTIADVRKANSIPVEWLITEASAPATPLNDGDTLTASGIVSGNTINANPPADISLKLSIDGATASTIAASTCSSQRNLA